MKNISDNRRFWDKAAGFYTVVQERFNSRFYKELATVVAPLFTSSDTVLEIGCGSGQLTLPLHSCVGKWVATDFSDKMVGQARKRLRGCSNVSFGREDATELSFRDDLFDIVVAANVLHVMPDPCRALREIRRVLNPGGILIAPTFVYDGRERNFRLKLLSIAGFRTYTKWSPDQFVSFVAANGFEVRSTDLLYGGMLTNCILIASKSEF